MATDKKVNIIKANFALQLKVGAGPLDERAVKDMQTVIDKNDVDFAPLGLSILEKLQDALDRADDLSVTMTQMKEMLIKPVMELKANATTFKYDLIGSLANIMLQFLETITVMDKDAIEIVQAHHNSLHMIIVRKISGNGGEAGKALTSELKNACDRYHHKKFSK